MIESGEMRPNQTRWAMLNQSHQSKMAFMFFPFMTKCGQKRVDERRNLVSSVTLSFANHTIRSVIYRNRCQLQSSDQLPKGSPSPAKCFQSIDVIYDRPFNLIPCFAMPIPSLAFSQKMNEVLRFCDN